MGVRCIAGVSKERAEIAVKMEDLFPFETLATNQIPRVAIATNHDLYEYK
jgi:hypothetical protein